MTPSKQRSAVSGSGAPPEARTNLGVPPIAATSDSLTATALEPTSSGVAQSLKWWPETSMSEAATHVLSPIFTTAQSSPRGTSTSGGAGGRRAEILRITSNSFKNASCPTSHGDRGISYSAGIPPVRAPRQRPRTLPLPGPGRPNSSRPSARWRAGSAVRPGPPPRKAQRPRAGLFPRAESGQPFSKHEAPGPLFACTLARLRFHLPDGLPENPRRRRTRDPQGFARARPWLTRRLLYGPAHRSLRRARGGRRLRSPRHLRACRQGSPRGQLAVYGAWGVGPPARH